MFFLKAVYIRCYTLSALLVSAWALWQLLQGQWLWLAPLLAWAPLWLLNSWRLWLGNLYWLPEREAVPTGLALLGMGLMLAVGERGPLLWWTLGGLFALLFYLRLATVLSRGVRESRGEPERLPQLLFTDEAGQPVRLADRPGSQLVVFFHSRWSPCGRMVSRELLALMDTGGLQPAQLVAIFAGPLPGWAQQLQVRGAECWSDGDGSSCRQLGLWLRGGSALLPGSANALRPALAQLDAEGKLRFWQVADNARLPPSPRAHRKRLGF